MRYFTYSIWSKHYVLVTQNRLAGGRTGQSCGLDLSCLHQLSVVILDAHTLMLNYTFSSAGQSLFYWLVVKGNMACNQHSNWPRLKIYFQVYPQVHYKLINMTLYSWSDGGDCKWCPCGSQCCVLSQSRSPEPGYPLKTEVLCSAMMGITSDIPEHWRINVDNILLILTCAECLGKEWK